MSKLCLKCNSTKPVDAFNRDKSRKDGLQNWCRECKKKSVQDWRKADPERARASNRIQWDKWYAENKHTYDHNRNGRNRRANGITSRLPKHIWQLLLSVHGAWCGRCGSEDRLTLDHIIPIAKGGTHTVSNMQVLCGRCNSSKGAHHSTDYRLWYYEVDV